MEEENVTIRRNKTTTANNSFDISFESTNSEMTRRNSLPDLSTAYYYSSDIEDLKGKVNQLKSELDSAHTEIEKLNTENLSLKMALNKERNKSRNLQQICSETKTRGINSKKNDSRRRNRISRNLDQSFNEGINNSCTDLGLNDTSEEIRDGTTVTNISTRHGSPNICNNTHTKELEEESHQIDGVTSTLLEPLSSARTCKQRKLCLISSNKTNKVLAIAQSTFPNDNICHYISTNCGIIQLLDHLEQKLSNYTTNDYCLIFIGEKDFRKTDNYYKLIINIRNILTKLKHTNILLCLPTYKFDGCSSVFNSRIETFNNLLYYDNCTHDYAMIFDSNLNLTYDETMFYKRLGVLNNYGMKNIFDNLKYYLDIFINPCPVNIDAVNSEICTDLRKKQFFRS